MWLVEDAYVDTLAKEFDICTETEKFPSTPRPANTLYLSTKQATVRVIQMYQ